MPGNYWRNIAYALRVLAKSPGVTLIAMLSLALGIGANSAIFSLINALILRTIAVPHPEQLVFVFTLIGDDPNGYEEFSLPMLEELAKRQRVFSGMFSYTGLGDMNNFEANGVRFASSLDQVDGDYYSVLGVQPLLGRLIRPTDVALKAGTSDSVAVITYRCWQTRYAGDTAVVGKTVLVGGRPFTIIGVTPKAFTGLIIDGGSEVTVPIAAPGGLVFRDRNALWLNIMGRLKPGVTLEQARAQLTALWPHILESTVPESYDKARRARFFSRRIGIESGATGTSSLRQQFSRPLLVLMWLVGMVLLIACVNLANLMLARAASRRQEMGIRAALGASGWQLMRQVLTESVILSLTGAALGLVIAAWTSRLLVRIIWTGYVPATLDPTPDVRVLIFTGVVGILTGILFGLAPALRIMRADAATLVRQTSRNLHGGSGSVGKVLVSGQVALSLVLLIGAILFARSLEKLRSVNPGFERTHILTMQLIRRNGQAKIPNRTAYYHQLVDKLLQVPGVEAASYSFGAPTPRYEYKEEVSIWSSSSRPIESVVDVIGPGFFHMIGMRILAGREFDWRDNEQSPHVVVISESLAERLFPGENPIGRKLDIGPRLEHKGMQIVGVVNSASLWRLQSLSPLAAYIAVLQEPRYEDPLAVLRTAQNPATVKTAAEKAVESLGQHYPLLTQTLEERSDAFLTEERITALLSAFFGGLALLLACIGLYGVMSYVVTQRTSEIGVRMALGAETVNVLALVLRQVIWLSLAGIAVGVPAAMAASRFISSMLFGLSPADPVTITSAIALLVAVALLAGYIPARRASHIEPMRALRAE